MTVKFFGAGYVAMMIVSIVDAIFNLAFGTDFSHLNTVLSFDLVEWKDFLIVSVPTPKLDWFTALAGVLSFDVFFFAGDWGGQYLRLIGALWITGSFVWAFFTQILPIMIELVKAAAGALNALNPFS